MPWKCHYSRSIPNTITGFAEIYFSDTLICLSPVSISNDPKSAGESDGGQ